MQIESFIDVFLFTDLTTQKKFDSQFYYSNQGLDQRLFCSYYIENRRCFSAFIDEGFDLKKLNLILQNCEIEGKIRWILLFLEEGRVFAPNTKEMQNKIKKNWKEYIQNISIVLLSKQTKIISSDLPSIISLNYQQNQIKDLNQYLQNKSFINLDQLWRTQGNSPLSPEMKNQYDKYSKEIQKYIEKRSTYKEIPILCQLIVFIRQNLIYEVVQKQTKEKNNYYQLAQGLKQNCFVFDNLKQLILFAFEKIEEIFKKNENLILYCEACQTFYYKRETNKTIVFPPNPKYNFSFDQIGQFSSKMNEENLQCRHSEQKSGTYFYLILTKLKCLLTLDQCQFGQDQQIGRDSSQNQQIKEFSSQVSLANQQSKQDKIIEDENIPSVLLIGKFGTGKTTLFKKLCGDDSEVERNTSMAKVKLCQSKNFYVIDTPAFELEDENNLQDQYIVNKFTSIFQRHKISRILLVVDFKRNSNLKQKIQDCLFYIRKFENKITFIVTQLDKSEDLLNDQKQVKEYLISYFKTIPVLLSKSDDTTFFLNEQLLENLKMFETKLEYLDLKDTVFDYQKQMQLEENIIQKLNEIKNQNRMITLNNTLEELSFLQNKQKSYYDQMEVLQKKKQGLEKELKEINQQIFKLQQNQPLTYEERQKINELEYQVQKMTEQVSQ